MVSLLYIAVSSILAVLVYFNVDKVWSDFEEWYIRFGIGVIVFILVQFVLLTPIRMWRGAVWVANIEMGLEGLWACHDRGVELLNEHHGALIKNEELARDSQLQNEYIANWNKKFITWTQETKSKIEMLYPLEAKRFKNVVAYNPHSIIGGLNEVHDGLRSMLLARLNKIDVIIERHQPSILPE